MKLKLSDVASIAEVIGAIAIVVSLIYVGVQVNDSTLAVRSATANETTNAISAWYERVGTDPLSSQLFLSAMNDPDSLSDEEWMQFVFLIHSMALRFQTAFYLAQEGTLDSNISQSFTATMSGNRELPGFLKYWEQRQSVFEPEFRAYLQNIISNGTTDTGVEAAYGSNRE